jgi:2-amino-4-hydroxy-6-hydroxymethyldihydropteridine diphosphokinase
MTRTAAYIGLGSNLADPRAQIERALHALATLADTRLVRVSRLYRSAPWGLAAQPDFVNAAAALETNLSPHALLAALLAIERAAGRERGGVRYGPRVIDLDLLVHGEWLLDEPGLHLPHPRLHERAFVLVPLVEIAPDLIVPGRGPARALLAAVDASTCRVLESAPAATE